MAARRAVLACSLALAAAVAAEDGGGQAAPDGSCDARKGESGCATLEPLLCHELWDKPACEREDGCEWFGDVVGAPALMCRPAGDAITCADLPTPTSCASVQGCAWYQHATFCFDDREPFPCHLIYEAEACGLSGTNAHGVVEATSGVCEWDHVTHQCVATASPPACDAVGRKDTCLERGCEWSDSLANRCHDKGAPAPPPPCGDARWKDACAARPDCVWATSEQGAASGDISGQCVPKPDVFLCAERAGAPPHEAAAACEAAGCQYVSDIQRLPTKAMCVPPGDTMCKYFISADPCDAQPSCAWTSEAKQCRDVVR